MIRRRALRLAAALPALALLALSGCGNKKYTCTLFTEFNGVRIPVKQVTVSSRKECAALAS